VAREVAYDDANSDKGLKHACRLAAYSKERQSRNGISNDGQLTGGWRYFYQIH
jgi:hypothetical protein